MKQGTTPTPDPDPRLSLESLEQQLRALPPAPVPEALSAKLIAGIPMVKAAGGAASSVTTRWPRIAGLVAALVTASAAIYSWQVFWNPRAPAQSKEVNAPAASEDARKQSPATSKAIQQYEEALRFDPYNADAWFNLAKAQAQVNRSTDAASSARKAIDIARSRNRLDFASAVEVWLRTHQAPKRGEPPRPR